MNNAKIAPQSVESEQSVLGAILIDNKLVSRCNLAPEAYYDNRNQVVFRAMLKLKSENKAIDILTIADFLESNNLLEKVGGRGYLVQLTQVMPSISNINTYIEIIQEKYVRRQLIKAVYDASEFLFDESKQVSEITDSLKRSLVGYHQKNYEIQDNPEMADLWLKNYSKPAKPMIKTGMQRLDAVIGGIKSHQVGVIIANSNVGKTTFALNMALNMAEEGKKVLFFSLEMTTDEIIDKCISITGDHNAFKIYDREATEETLLQTVITFKDYPLSIASRGTITSHDVMAEVYSRVMQERVDVVFIDYLQLLNDRSNGDGEVQRLTNIIKGLKRFALDFNIPIISPVQVDKESSKSGAIRLENIGGAKSIGDTADWGYYLYEKELKENYTDEPVTEIRLKNVKSRGTQKGQDFLVQFDRKSLKMEIN